MPSIIKSRSSAFQKHLDDSRRRKRRAATPAQVVLAAPDTYGVVISTPEHPPIDMSATAIEGYNSRRPDDQRAAILTSIQALMWRALDAGASVEEAQPALRGLQMLSELFEGDRSDPLLPAPRTGRPNYSEFKRARASLMVLARARQALDGCDLATACQKTAADVDRELRPDATLDQVLPRYAGRNRDVISGHGDRIKSWIEAETGNHAGRLTPDTGPARTYSMQAGFFDRGHKPTQQQYDNHLALCAEHLIRSSKKVTAMILERADNAPMDIE